MVSSSFEPCSAQMPPSVPCRACCNRKSDAVVVVISYACVYDAFCDKNFQTLTINSAKEGNAFLTCTFGSSWSGTQISCSGTVRSSQYSRSPESQNHQNSTFIMNLITWNSSSNVKGITGVTHLLMTWPMA